MPNCITHDVPPTKILFGEVIGTLVVGEPAKVRIAPGHILRTSSVDHFITPPTGSRNPTFIRTKNSIYKVYPSA